MFDLIAMSVARLCKAQYCHVFRFDGTLNDADVMLFVYRQEYYRLMRKPRERNREKFGERLAENGNVHARAEVIIG